MDETDEESVGSSQSQSSQDPDGMSPDEAVAEVKLLRRALEEQEEELRKVHEARVTGLTTALLRERHLVASINSLRPQYKPLHHIALRLVFEAIFSSEAFLDPFLGSGPDSPWSRALRTRTALTLVCRQWRDVALPFLYQDVVIRRVSQLAALRRTLEGAPDHYTKIRSMTLLCHIPGNMTLFATTAISEILGSCTSLTTLSLGPIFSAGLDCVPCVEANMVSHTAQFKAQVARVENLEYNWTFEAGDHLAHFITNIGAYKNLVHLKIFVPAPDYISRNVRLDSLKVFTLIAAEGNSGNNNLEPFCSWHFPQLEEVRFRPFIAISQVPHLFVEFLKLQKHLQVLDIGCCSVASSGEIDPTSLYVRLCEVLEARPSIRRLILPSSMGDVHILNSPLLDMDLDHVDVWTSLLDEQLPKAVNAVGGLLRWRSARLLDNGLSTILDLPHLLLPRNLFPGHNSTDRSTYVHDIFGMRIVETGHSIVRQDQPWDHAHGDCNVYALGVDNFKFDEDIDVDMDGSTSNASSDSDAGSYASTTDYDEDGWSSEDIDPEEVELLRYGSVTPEQLTVEEVMDIFATPSQD